MLIHRSTLTKDLLKVILSSITEPYAKSLTQFGDDRGIFGPIMNDLNGLKLEHNNPKKSISIKRVYYVYNHAVGTTRGWHMHRKEFKVFAILNGAAKFMALKLDKKGDKVDLKSFASSTRLPKLIVIPPGWANAWMSLEHDTILLCLSSSTLEQSIDDDVRYPIDKWGDLFSVQGR